MLVAEPLSVSVRLVDAVILLLRNVQGDLRPRAGGKEGRPRCLFRHCVILIPQEVVILRLVKTQIDDYVWKTCYFLKMSSRRWRECSEERFKAFYL